MQAEPDPPLILEREIPEEEMPASMHVGETVIIPVHGTIMRHAEAMDTMSGGCCLEI